MTLTCAFLACVIGSLVPMNSKLRHEVSFFVLKKVVNELFHSSEEKLEIKKKVIKKINLKNLKHSYFFMHFFAVFISEALKD